MEVRINFKKSFTLVEVLVSIALITIIGTASYFGIVTVSRANREAENQAMAINLAQKSIEEIRAYARDNFDMLSTIETNPQFTNVPSEFSRLGFQPIAIKVNKVDGSTELNNIDLTISWNDEKGNLRNYNYTFMVGRPADPLPGNIKGKVLNAATNEPVEFAEVTAIYDVQDSTLVLTRQTNAKGEYTFVDDTGNFILKPGDWSLEAKHSDFYDYPSAGNKHIETVSSGEETVTRDILMTPLPTAAKIKAQLVNKNNGKRLNLSLDADLWKDGKHYQDGYFDSSGKLHNNKRNLGEMNSVNSIKKSERMIKLNNMQAWKDYKVFWRKLNQIQPIKMRKKKGNYVYEKYAGTITPEEGEKLSKEHSRLFRELKKLSQDGIINSLELFLLSKITLQRIAYAQSPKFEDDRPYNPSAMYGTPPPQIYVDIDRIIEEFEEHIDILLELQEAKQRDEAEYQQTLKRIKEDVKAFSILNAITLKYWAYDHLFRLGHNAVQKDNFTVDIGEKYEAELERQYLDYKTNKEQGIQDASIVEIDTLFYGFENQTNLNSQFKETKQAIENIKIALPLLNELIIDLVE